MLLAVEQKNIESSTPYFFSLPLEIRQRICALVLISLIKRRKGPAPIMIQPEGYFLSQIHPSCLPLLRVCRIIQREAVPVLYREIVFQMSYPHSALAWLNAIGARKCWVGAKHPHLCAPGR